MTTGEQSAVAVAASLLEVGKVVVLCSTGMMIPQVPAAIIPGLITYAALSVLTGYLWRAK